MAAGWYYLFYSRAAQRLGIVEAPAANRSRVRLRRVGGFIMMLLGVCLYLGFFAVSWDPPSAAFGFVWLAVFAILAILIALALADIWLTRDLRRRALSARPAEPQPPPDSDKDLHP